MSESLTKVESKLSQMTITEALSQLQLKSIDSCANYTINEHVLPRDLIKRMLHLNGLVDADKRDATNGLIGTCKSIHGSQRMTCGGTEYCQGCRGKTLQGRPGHIAWDELELLHHGYATTQCAHIHRRAQQPGDEVEMLHLGAVNLTSVEPIQQLEEPTKSQLSEMAKYASNGSLRSISSLCNKENRPHVKINREATVVNYPKIPAIEPDGKNDDDSTLVEPSTSGTTEQSYKSQVVRVGTVEHKFVDGARIKIWRTFNRRAYLLVTGKKWLYLERGSENLLVTLEDGVIRRIEQPNDLAAFNQVITNMIYDDSQLAI